MRPGGSKSKGGAFERRVCKALSRWLSEGKQEDLFWRSAMSGGRATVRFKKGKFDVARQVGDVSATGPEGAELTDRFVIECKFLRRGALGLDKLAFGKSYLLRTWEQLVSLARSVNRLPMLVVKENHRATIVCLPLGTTPTKVGPVHSHDMIWLWGKAKHYAPKHVVFEFGLPKSKSNLSSFAIYLFQDIFGREP